VGYEIHMAQTRRAPDVEPWSLLNRASEPETILDGATSRSGRVFGTYVHGLFDGLPFTAALVDRLRARRGLPPVDASLRQSHREFLAARYAGLAQLLREHLALEPIWEALGIPSDPDTK
jgi:adenosylcobyric acid synthase